MTEEAKPTPLAEPLFEAFIDAYLKKHPELTRDEARKKLASGALDG
jgi:hypothetical protein